MKGTLYYVSSYSQWHTLDQEEGNLFKKSAISTIFNLGKDSELGEEFLDHFIPKIEFCLFYQKSSYYIDSKQTLGILNKK